MNGLERLIAQGLDVNVRAFEGATILQVAAGGRHTRIIRRLIDYGAHVNARIEGCKYGTALHTACAFNQLGSVKVLVEYGNAIINIKNTDGKTPRDIANRYGHKRICEYFDKIQDRSSKITKRRY